MHVEVEEMLNCRDLAQWLELVTVTLLDTLSLRALSERRWLPLVEPELPVGLERVAYSRQELIFDLHREVSLR